MQQERKITKFIKLLSKKEMQKFKLFLQSPYLNKSADLLIIYEILEKAILFKKEVYVKDDIFIKTFTKNNKKLSVSSLQKHLSNLQNQIQKFVSIENFLDNEIDQKIGLLKYFIKQKNFDAFNKLFFKLKLTLSEQKDSKQKFLTLLTIEELNFGIEKPPKRIVKNKLEINSFDEALDNAYLATKLFNAVVLSSRKKFIHYNSETFISDKLVELLKDNSSLKKPYIKAYFLALQVLNESAFKKKKLAFNAYLNHLNINANRFDKNDRFILYAILNSQSKFVFKSKKAHTQFLFNLFKNQLKQKTIFIDGQLNYYLFSNIVRVSILSKEFQWTEEFLNKYKNALYPEKFAKVVYNYNLGRFYFAQKDFENANACVSGLFIEDYYFQISIRRLSILIFFERHEFEILESTLFSFKTFVSPKRTDFISKEIRQLNKNFIKYMQALLKIEQAIEISYSKLKRIYSDLSEEENLPEKSWLLAKFQSILSKMKNN